ncbi:aminopeptidase P family N-terminal domain-containing protein [Amycolatopsis sp. GM8]|uniref:aminopeptidase P family N-terminal domain-containing protein n=1 Tax=Amycolatopsis sp. GM8 TaxID=2896530 RepID=UPI001F4468F0|nr:aminopeptidase P family N-terminal domain-containing protein [Amycolatopsis sp. GM8]
MKRGLVVLDPAEIPENEWHQRIDRVRERLTADGIEVALVYGDVYRSDDIAYLTNLCIYWNEGLLAIPADGAPALLTKLSPRVHTWMRRTSTLTDLRSGKAFGALVSALLADREPGTLGLVDAGLWPTALIDEVTHAAPGWVVRPLDGLVRQLRLRPSEPEKTLLRQAGAVLAEAAFTGNVSDVEQIVRDAGFTDVLVRPTATSVEITGQYRNNWLRVARDESLAADLEKAVDAVGDGVKTGSIPGARVVHHVDLSTGGEYVGQPTDRVLSAGEVVVVAIERDGAVAADTVLVTDSGKEVLTS